MKDKTRKMLAQKEFKKPVTKFEAIDLTICGFIPQGMTRAFKNSRFVIMVYDNIKTTHGEVIQVLIQKHDNTPIEGHWAVIQKIKNEIFGEETTAIEYYPAQSQLIDLHNIYWIWIFPKGILPMPIF